jgi:molybdenum cofactor synthesis domain
MSFSSTSSENAVGASEKILSFKAARHVVEQQALKVARTRVESLPLLSASGFVLAGKISADRDFPPFRRATRDGYALRATDVAKVPARLEVIGELKAGDSPDRYVIGASQAVAIMTGASLPEQADAVVMVEHTTPAPAERNSLEPSRFIEVQRSVAKGENFVPRAAEARAGQALLESGHRLNHSAIAIAASVGKSRVEVYRKPRVAIISTGDELVEIDGNPGPAQIRNSNSFSLASQVHDAGGEAVQLPIAPDEPKQLRALIEKGLDCDLLLLTGGVSMGKYDLVEQVLAELNPEFYFTGAEIQPGKPIVFGSVASGRKYFFGLPGNPVSTMVTFELFARPMIEAMAGMRPKPLIFPSARLKSEIRTKTGLTRFLPAILSGEFERAEVELARWQGSGDIAALARANCYVVIPPDRERIDAGEWVPLLMR